MTHGHWVTCLQRDMTTGDMLRLQGVDEWHARGWQLHISEVQFHGIIGNAIPIPLLERILVSALYAAGLVTHRLHDKYADEAPTDKTNALHEVE